MLGGDLCPSARSALGSVGISLCSSPLLQAEQALRELGSSLRTQGRWCERGCSLRPKLETPVLSGHLSPRPR